MMRLVYFFIISFYVSSCSIVKYGVGYLDTYLYYKADNYADFNDEQSDKVDRFLENYLRKFGCWYVDKINHDLDEYMKRVKKGLNKNKDMPWTQERLNYWRKILMTDVLEVASEIHLQNNFYCLEIKKLFWVSDYNLL